MGSDNYRPTVGVRIMEVECDVRSQKVVAELWDVSGDKEDQAKRCWRAISKDAVGAILVYNPEKQEQEVEVENWYQWFPKGLGLSPAQVLVVQSLRRSDMPRRMPLPQKLASIGVSPAVQVTPDDLPAIRKYFNSFMETVRQTVLERQRQEEEDVMKGG